MTGKRQMRRITADVKRLAAIALPPADHPLSSNSLNMKQAQLPPCVRHHGKYITVFSGEQGRGQEELLEGELPFQDEGWSGFTAATAGKGETFGLLKGFSPFLESQPGDQQGADGIETGDPGQGEANA